jgi:Uma2 family endonuclease
MTTVTTHATPAAPAPIEIPGPVLHVPSLDKLHRLTDVPDRRVVFRSVDWAFYEELVGSIPEGCNIHVDYDGRDLEVMSKGPIHEKINRRFSRLIDIITEEWEIDFTGLGETTWKRQRLARGLEADQCYYFLPAKLAQELAAARRGGDIDDYPNPDLAIEVDISRPQVDRAGIYAALVVTELWRFDGEALFFERLTPDGTYAAVTSSGFLPVQSEEVRRWILEDPRTEKDWAQWVRAEVRKKRDAERPRP